MQYVPIMGSEGMMGELLDLLGSLAIPQGFKNFDDSGMKRTSSLLR
jgi:hypothetical protein